ncbi:MAG: group 1 truncated hemoglobin, partial [Bacteroidota bacterium]
KELTNSIVFNDVDVSKQSAKMKTFLAYAFGAPMNYDGKDMRTAHAHMNLKEEHFGAVSEHLVATLEELKVSRPLIEEVMHIVASTKADVLNQ